MTSDQNDDKPSESPGEGEGRSTEQKKSESCSSTDQLKIEQARVDGWKVFKTLFMTMTFISVGLFLEITGPTLPYLKDRVGVNYEEVSRVLLVRSIGNFVGSICGGFLVDAFLLYAEMVFSILLLLAAIATGATPWCTNLSQLGALFFLTGLTQGGVCTGVNAFVMKLWGEKSGPALVSQHFGFGIGALLAPQLAKAFIRTVSTESTTLGYDLTSLYPEKTTDSSGFNTTLGSTSRPTNTVAEIEYPYVIIGIITGLFSIIFLCFFIVSKCKKNRSVKNESNKMSIKDWLRLISPSSCTGGHPIFGVFFFILLAVLFMHIVGGERVMSKFLYSFAVESDLKFKPGDASDLNSAFWFAFTAGRGINVILALFCPLPLLLGVDVAGNVINGIVLAVWGSQNATILWVFSCSFGLFLSPLFPTVLVWANLYVEMTAVGVAVAYVGSAVGGMIYQWLGGYLLEYHGPPSIMFLILGFSLNLGLVYAILQGISAKHGNRFSPKKSKVAPFPEVENQSTKF